MLWHVESPDRPTIPSSAMSAMVLYALYWVWFLWIMCFVKFKVVGEGTSEALISTNAYWLGTGLCLVHILWLGGALVRTTKRRDSLRIPHLASLSLGILLMISMQYGYQKLRAEGPSGLRESESLFETWSDMRAEGRNPLSFPLWR